jgi:hypothetical protein
MAMCTSGDNAMLSLVVALFFALAWPLFFRLETMAVLTLAVKMASVNMAILTLVVAATSNFFQVSGQTLGNCSRHRRQHLYYIWV